MMTKKEFIWPIHISDHIPHGVCIIHVDLDSKGQPVDWTFVECNQALAEMEGFSKEDLLGSRFFDLFPNGSRKWLKYYYAAAYEDTYHEFDEISEEIGIYLHIAAIPTSEKGYCLCILKNIREDIFEKNRRIKELEQAVIKEKAAQSKLKQALDDAHLKTEIISAISKGYKHVSRVDIHKDLYEEISCDDENYSLSGKTGSATKDGWLICDTLIAPEYQEAMRKFLDVSTLPERLKNQETIYAEYRMNNGDWQRMRYSVKKRDSEGNVTHVLCTVRSTTEEKLRENDLRFAAEIARRETEVKTRFLDTMSHDIRTPLNGVIGMIKLANQHEDDPDMLRTLRHKETEALKCLVDLVNNVLDINKLQSGTFHNHVMSFDLIDILKRANHKYAVLAEKKGIKYNVKWILESIRHPYLKGNPLYLERILSNIADNAVKFSPSGSTINVWMEENQTTEEDLLITFYCQDEGCGMSEDFIKHAFDLFSQEDADSSRTKIAGSGLGLAIANEMAKIMGGSIELQSTLGEGTTAIIRLPFKLGTQDEIFTKDTDVDNIPIKGIRALVVEDNELNMEIATALLEHNGLEVTCAKDGQEAVEIFKNSSPGYFGVIYMDIMMPRMNGLDATKAIRAMKRMDARCIGIIAMSANAYAEDINGSRLAGMDIHLAKPLDEEKMIGALKKCMVRNESLVVHD